MSGYIGTQPVPQATQTRDSFTATSGQTSFATGGYTPNFLDVYLNGVKLSAADYTATNGSDVVLASGAATGDILEVVAFTTFNSASSSIDDNGNATALTIDSSENVMINTTDSSLFNNTTGGGFMSASTGRTDMAREANVVTTMNRTGNSDGDILEFRKDGTVVGSIGVNTDRVYLATTSKGVCIDQSAARMIPTDASGNTNDADMDLGQSNGRWKDAYLSGGIYLGGVGSANKLEDYEEGTWTPTLGGNAQYDIQSGDYIKVGGLVYASFAIRPTSLGTGSDNRISGLPFSTADSVGLTIQYYDGAATNHYSISGGVTSNYLNIYLKTSSINSAYNSTTFFQNNARIYASIIYRTTA